MATFKVLPFQPERVPYFYLTRLGERRVRVQWTWNYVTQQFVLRLLDPQTEALLWARPVLYGTNLLHGCTVEGLEELAIIPLDPDGAFLTVGITPENAKAIRMWLVNYG